MPFEFFSATDTGRARSNNEDSVAVDEASALLCLADGMGGYNAGEVASGMAIFFIRASSAAGCAASEGAVRRRRAPRDGPLRRPRPTARSTTPPTPNARYAGMGTTLVVGVLRDDRLLLGHVGRLALPTACATAGCTQITRDHSLLQEQIDAGLITAEQALLSSHRNLVTRAVGVEPTCSSRCTSTR